VKLLFVQPFALRGGFCDFGSFFANRPLANAAQGMV
jgi:hypothetical protein